MTNSVFVYGTLMQGQRNHAVLNRQSPVFLGSAVTVSDKFTMLAFPSQSSAGKITPGVLQEGVFKIIDAATQFGRISGELYRVSDVALSDLDMLENVGVNYDRVEVEVRMCKGVAQNAWLYVKRSAEGGLAISGTGVKFLVNRFRWREPEKLVLA